MQDTEEAEYDSSAEQVDSSTETQKMTGEELFQEETSEEEDPGEKISSGEEIAEQFTSGNPPVVTESFGDGEKTDTDKDTNENTDEDTEGIRYIKGRPLTEEEREAELEPIRNLTPLDAGPEVESNLTSVYAAYGDTDTAYPETYDSRALGFVTPVKNQNPFGTCWAFGMAAVMETSLLAQKKGTYDLSEEHLSYFFSNRQNDPLGNTANDQNTVLGNYHSIGGNDYLAALFLSTWSGMTTEDDVPFPTDDSHTQDLSYEISASKCIQCVRISEKCNIFQLFCRSYERNASEGSRSIHYVLYVRELCKSGYSSILLSCGKIFFKADQSYCDGCRMGR